MGCRVDLYSADATTLSFGDERRSRKQALHQLNRFYADFPFLLGTSFPNPDYPTVC